MAHKTYEIKQSAALKIQPASGGFSLLEISVVIAVIALIAGGILAGKNMIHATQLRSITDDATTYAVAIQQFKDKYGELPGDFYNATKIWGFAGTTASPGCATHSGAAVTAGGTCDGDGNNIINPQAANPGETGESFQAWKQLALAGFVRGTYSGNSGSGSPEDYRFIAGTQSINSPQSGIAVAGWMASYVDHAALNSSHMFKLNYQNALGVGSNLNQGTGAPSWADDGFISNADAFSIDSKLDDGMPATGNVHAMGLDTGCTNAASNTIFTATYNVALANDTACALLFLPTFKPESKF